MPSNEHNTTNRRPLYQVTINVPTILPRKVHYTKTHEHHHHGQRPRHDGESMPVSPPILGVIAFHRNVDADSFSRRMSWVINPSSG